jgi:glutamyl-tRNA synthetase
MPQFNYRMLTRFAPSPTGYLHIGNVRTAIFSYILAKKNKGKFILRIDDTDLDRSKKEYDVALRDDLSWLGISYDNSFYQSERFSKYDEALEFLLQKGRVYKCFESQEELETKRKLQLGRGQPPIYDRSSLKLSPAQIESLESSGKRPHYRFLLEHKNVAWVDSIKGEIIINPTNMSDPIIKRENGIYTYMLPSSIDDLDYNITHITRGEDHITNTAIQIQMMEALREDSSKAITFAHLPLLKIKEGKLSKRSGSLEGTIKYFRSENFEPITLLTYLSKLGTSDNIEPKESMEQLIYEFSISKFSASPATFELEVVEDLNTKILHQLSYDAVRRRTDLNFSKEFWDVIKENIVKLSDLDLWHRVCFEQINVEISKHDKDFLEIALQNFPKGDVDENTWGQWIENIKKVSPRKGRDLFHPIRLALTGLENGPEMKKLLPIIGRKVVLERLGG